MNYKWTDINGTEHNIDTTIMMQPNCKYLLPCGLCDLTNEHYTCTLLRSLSYGKEETT